jgi:hypothetical protein
MIYNRVSNYDINDDLGVGYIENGKDQREKLSLRELSRKRLPMSQYWRKMRGISWGRGRTGS